MIAPYFENCLLTNLKTLFTVKYEKYKLPKNGFESNEWLFPKNRRADKSSESNGWRLGDSRPDTQGKNKNFFYSSVLALISNTYHKCIRDIKATLRQFTENYKKKYIPHRLIDKPLSSSSVVSMEDIQSAVG